MQAGREVYQRGWAQAATWQEAAIRRDIEILEGSDQPQANVASCVPPKKGERTDF